jgi:hypothetical protein
MGGMDEGVGARLREARSRRRIGLPEVEAAIKIRGRYLRAMESEDWDQLPGDTYARAFIRTYANFLGLDGERLAEEHRRGSGAARPGERLPRVDPSPQLAKRRPRQGGPRISPKLVTAAVVALVVAALLVIGLSSGGGSKEPGPAGKSAGKARGKRGSATPPKAKSEPAGHSLALVAQAEVWVCLLDGKDRPLVNGVILGPGAEEGPFRSGSFTLALGNGAVTMTVDGKQQKLPQPASPVGFRVDRDGKVSEIPEGERPTCT